MQLVNSPAEGAAASLKLRIELERSEFIRNMAAPLDDMFSLCVDAGKTVSSVEVRFIDNLKVRDV